MASSKEETLLLASLFHEKWREGRALGDGSFEPRWKETSDGDWIAQNGKETVDIANTPYEDLPEDWQAENLAAAVAVLEATETSDTLQEAASRVHEAWLDRNSEWAEDHQKLPFQELSEEEQAKDTDQVLLFLQISTRFALGADGESIVQEGSAYSF